MIFNQDDIIKTDRGIRYYKLKTLPDIPLSESDEYVITTIGDRLDILAYHYYGNTELWKIISIANPHIKKDSLFPPVGTQLRIPGDISSILEQ